MNLLNWNLQIGCKGHYLAHTVYLPVIGVPRFPSLERNLLVLASLVTEPWIMTKLVAYLALELFCWALESLSMNRIAILGASICILACRFGLKISLEPT